MHDIVFFYPKGHQAHAERGHPERPERVEALRQALEEGGWWLPERLVPALELPEKLLQSVHTPAYLNLLEMTCRRGGGRLDADTYCCAQSWQLALQAAGGAMAVAQAVWRGQTLSGRALRGFSLSRPPGHHATRGQGMGFCLLNNIALAAEYLLQNEGAQRLAIVDLDLHHGNGTQDIFWRRQDVLYLSVHQSPLFPGSGGLAEVGDGPGTGFTANFPVPPFSGDQAFLAVMDSCILPLLERYQPEMLLISYGFDAHWSNPLGSLLLSAPVYGALISRLARFADEHCRGRIALVLEGGYNLEAGRLCTQAVTAALVEVETPAPSTARPSTALAGYSAPQGIAEPHELGTAPFAALQLNDVSPYVESSAWQAMVASAKELWGLSSGPSSREACPDERGAKAP